MLRQKLLRLAAGLLGVTALASLPTIASAQSGEPIKIGFSMSLTGPLAANGKQALLGAKIWEEEINGKGGLIGRPVKLVYYDDQSNPSQALRENSASSAASATVVGFGFCASAVW